METKSNKKVSFRRIFIVSGFSWIFDAMDVGLISFIAAALIIEWNLTPQEAGLLGSVNAVGMFIGAIVAGALADRVGRNKILMYTVLLFSLSSGVSAFSTTFAVFLIFRFFIGLGLGGELPVASTLVAENVPDHKRGRMVVLLESFWAVGWILSAMIAYFIMPIWGWRSALIIGALPALLAIYMRKGLPDSPQFQSTGKKNTSILQNIKTLWSPKYAKDTSMLWILWLLVMFSYHGMFLWLPSVMVLKGFGLIKSFGYVLLMTLTQLPGFFSAAWLVEKVGRKFVLISYLIMAAISAIIFGNAESLPMLIAGGMALSFFFLGVTGTTYAYTTDHYDSSIRATGAGFANAAGRIGAIIGPLVVGTLIAKDVSFTTIFIMFFVTSIIAALNVLFLGKETRVKQKLEDEEQTIIKEAL
ncbi:MFS transporter [Neobacillus niacini]|uniref:MFS transporter n=1 Tax=Neobacillus niacini TaxID=86668 RepID=UPI0007AB70FD|nr:MFS transporter [Neobacillus niacini]MEC1522804.1 MFS transporter [Neobacillus niacini]